MPTRGLARPCTAALPRKRHDACRHSPSGPGRTTGDRCCPLHGIPRWQSRQTGISSSNGHQGLPQCEKQGQADPPSQHRRAAALCHGWGECNRADSGVAVEEARIIAIGLPESRHAEMTGCSWQAPEGRRETRLFTGKVFSALGRAHPQTAPGPTMQCHRATRLRFTISGPAARLRKKRHGMYQRPPATARYHWAGHARAWCMEAGLTMKSLHALTCCACVLPPVHCLP